MQSILPFPSLFSRWPVLGLIALWSAMAVQATAAEDAKAALRVLRDECLGCHKPGKAKGGLLLTNREKMLAGGDSGAAVVPGKAEESPIYQLALEKGDPHMPPKKQLSTAQVAALKAWIDAGAVWDAAVFDELPSVKPVAMSPLPSSYQPVLALAVSPDGRRLAVAAGARVNIHDLSKPGRPMLGALSGHESPVQSVVWSADGGTLVTGGFRSIRVWDATSLQTKSEVKEKLVGNITSLAMQKDGAVLFAADGEAGGAGFIHKVDLATGKISLTWKAHEDNIYGLRLSPDGTALASAAADKLARLWNTADGRPVAAYEGHTNHVLGLAFNKDGSQLATAGADREIKVWNVKSREQDVKLGDKKTVITALDWTPDGRAVVAVTEKGGGAIYTDLVKHTGVERSETSKQTRLSPVAAMLYCVAATPDAKTIFAGGDDGKVWTWDGSGKSLGNLTP